MSVRRISPHEAHDLIEKQGYAYLDVRSIPEYEAGHPAGAYNVPLLHFAGGRMAPNGEFLDVVRRRFAPDAKIVVGCKSGGRSQQAAQMMEQAGYTALVEMRGGFGGERDPLGRTESGWAACGLPVSSSDPGRAYEDLRAK